VSDANYARVVKHFGETGAVDLIGVIGYYTLVSDDPQRRPRPHAGRRAGAAAAARMTSDRDASRLTRDLLRFDTVTRRAGARLARHAGALLEAWGFRVELPRVRRRAHQRGRAGGRSDAKARCASPGTSTPSRSNGGVGRATPYRRDRRRPSLRRGSSDMKAGVAAILSPRRRRGEVPGTPGV